MMLFVVVTAREREREVAELTEVEAAVEFGWRGR